MLHYADAKKITADDKPFIEKYILSCLHSVGFDLPTIGTYLTRHGSASAKFPHRIIYRTELLPLLGYTEDDLHLLRHLHSLGLTLFDLKYFFDIDFDIHQANDDETERVNVDDAPESDPTYIAEQLWNDLEEEAKTAIQTKYDRWVEKKGRTCQTLLVQLKFGNGGTVLAAPNGLMGTFCNLG
ncbi:unnamed protein product [Didymodactylos carnosus]|uniref:Uncharacterized protein n=1 Tax=Didymodactylos carnosus TaxID=1234261 RepID=A0A816B424_9BILA|nr:unnamed protein product [Didymodactylos carnosus]CAF1605660.1 unnamed protein product [Didymodactylos carnosus]CAF3783391.1 unnamed protein product [Didymodactylos carnosus]CAF4485384.1 unnamed protein product [Didymodactylos carnosus]